MRKLTLIGIGFALLWSPHFVSADAISDLKYQIQLLTTQIQTLQQGLTAAAAATLSDDYGIGDTPNGTYCPQLSITMKKGARDVTTRGQVSELQAFLTSYYNLDENIVVGGYFGNLTHKYVVQFQRGQGLPAFGIVGSLTRAKIARVCDGSSNATTSNTPVSNSNQNTSSNYNLGTMAARVIVANISETGNTYGSIGIPFTQSKLAEADQAMQRLNTFVQASSYGKAQLQWKTSGVYDLGSGVCNHSTYGEKVDDLRQRALAAADKENPLSDYSFYVIVHPTPDCSDGVQWSFEGKGTFTAYTLNGRVVHLRGIHISDLSDLYFFHEFGHMLGYQDGGGIGHPDYMNCPLNAGINGDIIIPVASSCSHIFDFYSGKTPVFDIMSTNSGILSDYSAPDKEIVGWLSGRDFQTATSGQYILTPLEQTGGQPKALKISVPGTTYTAYLSFRQPNGYTYPDAPANKPNGVILDVTNGSGSQSFLITNATNNNAPLVIGKTYRIGTNGPFVTVTGISNNRASITLSSNATISPIPPTLAIPTLTFNVTPSLISTGQSSTLSWSTTNTNRCVLQYGQNDENVAVSGSKVVSPSQTTPYRLICTNDSGTGKDGPSAEKTVTVTVSTHSLLTPAIIFNASPSTIGAVQNSTLSWSTSNANRCVLQYGSTEENVSVSGSKVVSPSQTTSYKLVCINDPGNGKDGPNAKQTAIVSVASPSCSLTTNKSSYQYGETITFSWSSQNATYAMFQRDTSGKDHLNLSYEKLGTSGSYPVNATVTGNPSVTLLVYNHYGNSSCDVTIPVN